ncbi:hypothetical protein B0T16DRAFT_211581 [Cercophora newfieldiana]|uniref:Uncharacterized protein n=1 Tax=Cercophora newfieldiana TaxID=92897 RepID=A0AA40CJJ1_9PEZI|nr:hypothetical protein B0T16DRAFT_211581 [Cercophora newfieldiana]
MAVEGAVQGLVAAFTFGFVVNAASAALFLYTKGHGSIFRDSERLVLLLFLLSAALWAQIDFVTVLLDVRRSSMSCQVGIIFATVLDQLARFSIEQYLVWAMNHGQKPTVWQMVPQFVVLGRFVAGAVFAGFTRPQIDTFCVATSSTFPVAVVVIVLDVVTLLLLTARAFSSANEVKASELARRVSHKLVLLGFSIWTASSVPMLLGIRTVELVARTAVPAIGLTILIIIMTGCAGTLTSSRDSSSRPPEAPSPRRINISRDISTSDSDYPPSRYEDLKEAAIRSSTTFVNPREAPTLRSEPNPALPWESRHPPSAPENVAAFGRARKVDQSGAKGGIFGFGKAAPSITVAKVMIGNPILQDNDPQNPLNKIATIGLDEAARAERERRLRMQIEPPVPARPVTQNLSPEEVMKRGMSVKRKEVQSIASQPAGLQAEGAASSTAAQLSPGVEEIRRRSPRQASPEQVPPMPRPARPISPEPVAMPEPEPALQMAATQPWIESPPLQALQPKPAFTQAPAPRPEIRPSRQAPPSPKKAPEPEPEKSALQRRPTIGLPTNPKARAMKVAQDAGAQAAQQQIMFVNNIVYNDPTAVQKIIKGASDMAAKNAAAAEKDDASVVNRPRPIPRKGDAPQPSPSPKHRRSRSGSLSRKSILTSAPGSPTQLPPLPPPPLPGTSIRPQPNATKSMTVDEKMTMFFPSPPSGGATKRGSPAPQLPPIPVSYLSTGSPTETHRSNRTTKTSFKTESILDVDEIPRKMPVEQSRFSPMTEMDLAGEIGGSWLPGIEADNRSTGRSRQAATAKRASSPIIPPAMPDRSSAWTEDTDARTDDDATTNWGTVHSPELAVGVQVVKMPALPSTVRPAERRAPAPPQAKVQAPAPENITFMLDELDFDHKGSSWLLESEPKEVKPERSTPSPSQWHRRVGDECPTFSAREKTRSRKAPAPTPLTLNGAPSRNKIIIQAEPSPLTSPEHALQEIQAQLKKLEDANRDSMNSPSRRLALLENLEREMGQQEDHWQEMKHDLGRDSMTSVQTTSPGLRNSRIEPAVVAHPQAGSRSSIALERRASRRARMRSGVPKGADAQNWSPEMERTTATTTTSGWQKRLTEAQSEYMEAAAELLRTRNTNLMPMPALSMAQLGSPTPPESDQSDVEEVTVPSLPRMTKAQPVRKVSAPVSLWKPTRKAPSRPTLMWAPIQKRAPEPEVELPGLFVRPAPRKESAPLQISSSELWRKPYVNDSRSGNGLWRPAWASAAPPAKTNRSSTQGIPQLQQQQSQKAPRPLTQRPPRRNKRMTLLPDILESPKPLPDKRGTLGIFQFPWGERSDTAMAMASQGRPSYMAMPGTMASGGPSITAAHEQRSKQLESAEYASSFFDDYDDDDEDNSDDGEGDESDDFDETTLWEIASLLKTDNVPSKNSLFPPAREKTSSWVVAEHMDDIPSDDDRSRSSSREQSIVIGLDDILFEQPTGQLNLPQKPKGRSQAIVTDEDSSMSWTLEEEYASKRAPSPPRAVVGLPSNPKASKIPRAAAVPPVPVPALPKPSQIPRLSEKKAAKAAKAALWKPTTVSEKPSSTGLFDPHTGRTTFRTTSEEPAAITITRTPRPSEAKPLDKLTSSRLWTATPTPKSTPSKLWSFPALPRPIATPADWALALRDALIASHTRRAYPASAWASALDAAILLSSPARNTALRHPVFFASSLVTTSEWFHPAATGYTYDVAAVHPSFFGSLAITCQREAVHPAMESYAAKKLRRQRSKVSTRERPAERANSVKKDKEEIRAQIRALEMGQDGGIMAQIEALEQERLFVQRAAEEEYKRRMSSGYGLYTEEKMVQEPEQVEVLLAPEEVVASVQRRMSLAMRRESSVKRGSSVKRERKRVGPVEKENGMEREKGVLKGLWAAPEKADAGKKETEGLWTRGASGASEEGSVEDGEAYERRARGRKARGKVARRAEILKQIAMIEQDVDPMAEFRAQRMWSVRAARAAGGNRSGKRSWLHERKPSRVMLRY